MSQAVGSGPSTASAVEAVVAARERSGGGAARAVRVRSGWRAWLLVPLGLLALAVSLAVAITIGPADLGPADVLAVVRARLLGGESGLSAIQEGIIWDLRLPRGLLAALCGAGLAVCGVVLQSLLRNPLADPFVLGVSSGASTGAVISVVSGVGAVGLATGAFAGAVGAFALVLVLAFVAGGTTDRVVLAGVAATQLFSALTSVIVYLGADAEQTRGVMFWLLGSLASATWTDVALTAALTGAGLLACLAYGGVLDAFALGRDTAAALGVAVVRTQLLLLVVTALITATIVSTSGAIGFVGLVLPHAARALVGIGHRRLLPVAAVLGAVFLLWVDTLARTVLDPHELPVGVATALVGVPAFVVVLVRRRARPGR